MVGVSYISELVTAKEMELVGNICVMLTIILLTTMVVSVLVSRLVTNPVQRLIRAMEEFERCGWICLSASGRHYGDRGIVPVL